MTTIVKHRRTGNEYILLGINGEVDKVNPSRFISELFAQEKSKSEVSCSATVCDVQGNIFLAYIDDLTVVEIDGKKPVDLLPEPTLKSVDNDIYQQQTDDFDDEDLEAENFDNPEDTSVETPITSTYSQSSSQQSDLDNDDDDWI